jgi:hypothetical protein
MGSARAVPAISEHSVSSGANATTASVDRCPVCRDKVLVKLPGEVLIRNAILRVDARTGRVAAKCGRCKSWVEVPLRYVG